MTNMTSNPTAALAADEIRAPFTRHDDGMITDFNVIDTATGVQIWSGPDTFTGARIFWVGLPGSARNTGARAVVKAETIDEAYRAAETLRPAAARSMARRHAAALRMNGGR